MSWTDERVALLSKLWADGLSASQIAAELGGITRNAVIGKVHRLGLSGRAKSPSSSSPRPRKARSSGMLRVSRPSMRGNTALRLRIRGRARAGADRDPDRAAQDAVATDREDLPLAGRRPGQRGFLLLRRRKRQRDALLRATTRASPISRSPIAGGTSGSSGVEFRPSRRSGRRARSRRRARCGSGRRRGRG